MKKLLRILGILIVLAGAFLVIWKTTTRFTPAQPTPTTLANPASVYCEQQSGTLEMVTDASGAQSGICHLTGGVDCEEWAYFRGECPSTGENELALEMSLDGVDSNLLVAIKSRANDSTGHCDSSKIGNIKQLETDINNKTGGMIDKISLRNACGETIEYSSDMSEYKMVDPDSPRLSNLTRENERYLAYSLIDRGRDAYYREYPVIIYDKSTKINKLLTIRPNVPMFEYLDNKGNIIIARRSEAGRLRWLFDISSNSAIGEYDTPRQDCGNEALGRSFTNYIVLHKFNESKCGFDHSQENPSLEGTLTYNDSTTPLGKFNINSKLNATYEDMIESVKGNTLIFHIDDTRYELSNNKLLKK